MKKLIAIYPILFGNRNYRPGDELPTHNRGFVDTWTNNGAAAWKDEEESESKEPKKQTVKARSVTAPAGLSGEANPSLGPEQDLIGKPPSGKVRGAQPEPSKGKRKSGE